MLALIMSKRSSNTSCNNYQVCHQRVMAAAMFTSILQYCMAMGLTPFLRQPAVSHRQQLPMQLPACVSHLGSS